MLVARRRLAACALAVAALLAMVVLPVTLLPGRAAAAAHSRGWWALKHAESRAGDWYAWGGSGPAVFDCSGLVMWAYAQVGRLLPHSTYSMLASGQIYPVPASQREQGDLAFFGTGHVELVTRHGTFGALHSGTQVGWHAITAWWHPTMYFRVR